MQTLGVWSLSSEGSGPQAPVKSSRAWPRVRGGPGRHWWLMPAEEEGGFAGRRPRGVQQKGGSHQPQHPSWSVPGWSETGASKIPSDAAGTQASITEQTWRLWTSERTCVRGEEVRAFVRLGRPAVPPPCRESRAGGSLVQAAAAHLQASGRRGPSCFRGACAVRSPCALAWGPGRCRPT